MCLASACSCVGVLDRRTASPQINKKNRNLTHRIAEFGQNVSAAGARVTTVSTEAHQSSKEPDRVDVTVEPSSALGISFAVGGVVRQVNIIAIRNTSCADWAHLLRMNVYAE